MARPGYALVAKLLAVLLAVACTLTARALYAAPARVVLLRPAEASAQVREAIHRAQAELATQGFEVVVKEAPSESDPRRALEQAAAEEHAIAALSVFAGARGAAADLWVADRLTDKTVIRRVDVSDVAPAQRPNALAIRTVELLRASLVEAVSTHESLPQDVARFVEPAGAPLEGFGMQLGVALVASVDGLGVAGAPAARLSYGTRLGLAGRISLVGPAFGARAEGALGSASVRQERLSLELVYAPEVSWAGFTPEAWLGVGGYHLYANGELLPPAVGASDEVWALAGSLGAGLGYRLTDHVMVLADLEALFTVPRAVVTMRGDKLGSAGRPTLVGSFGVAARF